MLTALAPAKLNLALHITGKRDDGYHEMESLVAFAEAGDELSIFASDELTLHVSGDFASYTGSIENNLVLRAAHILRAAVGETRGACIELTKNLPVGAGLGGGSSDAAVAAVMLLKLWGHIFPAQQLSHILAPLGADMNMCLKHTPLIARGIGDDISPLQFFPSMEVVLVWPNIVLSTPEVYRRYQHEYRQMPSLDSMLFEQGTDWISALSPTRNMLTRAAIACAPEVAEVLLALETLPGNALVRMTGSGACCAAYYSDAEEADAACAIIRARYPEWWCKRTRIMEVNS